MQAQTQMAKGELLLEIQGKTASRAIREITPHGVKMEMTDDAQATGKYNANAITTTTVFMKPDGSNEWENKSLQQTRDGDMVVVQGRGTGHATGPGTASWQGDVVFMTQSPKLAWLNTTKGWIEGSGDMAAGTFHGKVYAKK